MPKIPVDPNILRVKIRITANDRKSRIWDRFKILAINNKMTTQQLLGKLLRDHVGKHYN